MSRVQVFDPPMCCSTGVCGPSIDPALTRFAADLDWLSRQGMVVERFNLAQEPAMFANDATVKAELAEGGTAVLPLVFVDRKVVSRGKYPARAELAAAVGLQNDTADKSLLSVMGSGCCGPSGCC